MVVKSLLLGKYCRISPFVFSFLARLRAELARVKMERDILKKATGAQRRVRSHHKFSEVRLD